MRDIHVLFELTSNCNLKCLHCYNESGPSCVDDMTDRQVQDFVEDVAKLKPRSFCFYGGEPLLRSNLLCRLSGFLSYNGITTTMVSNGFLIDAEMARRLREFGISIVQLSMDGEKGSHNRLRQHPHSHDRVLAALGHLRQQEITVILAFCPTRWNTQDLAAIIKIAESHGVQEIRVQRMMPTGQASQHPGILPTEDQYRSLFKKIHQHNVAYIQGRSKVKIQWDDCIHQVYLARDNPDGHKASLLYVRPNGDLSACSYLPITLGNVTKYPPTRYWDAGFENAWQLDIMKERAAFLTTVTHMDAVGDPVSYDLVEAQNG